MMSLSEFTVNSSFYDFQRSNMFSVIFASSPTSNAQSSLSSLGGYIYSNIAVNTDWLGLRPGQFTQNLTKIATAGVNKIAKSSGISKYLIGAMTSRVVDTLLGDLAIGTSLLEFFNISQATTGLMVYSVKLPDVKVNYDIDRSYNAPNIKVKDRDLEPLVVTFRMASDGLNYRAMCDWVNSVVDPITNLRALPADVEAQLQVNLHNRAGVPHTVSYFTGVIPTAVSLPTLTYDSDNQITTFDVTFFYRSVSTGAVDSTTAAEWLLG